MSGIREMIENVREEFSASDYQYPMAKMDRKIEILVDTIINMEGRIEDITRGFEKRIADLELSLATKGRIIDTLCEELGKMEDFQARTEPCINTLSREVGVLERKQAKAADEHVIVSTNIDTLFRANVDRNKEYQKLTEKYNREFAECNKDILGTHMTLMKYKRENEMMSNRITDLNTENQSRDSSLDSLRLKLIDVLDEAEKNTSEATEIKRMAIDIYTKT
jgi:chromosome segregation ATPase